MRRSQSFGVLAAIMTAAVIWASPAIAATPWFGTYDVSVRGGEQHTAWTFNHVPTSSCDAAGNGQGTDTQTFLPGAPQVTQMSGVGSTAFPATISNLQLSYTEDREGSITYGQPAEPNGPGCGVASAEANPSRRHPTAAAAASRPHRRDAAAGRPLARGDPSRVRRKRTALQGLPGLRRGRPRVRLTASRHPAAARSRSSRRCAQRHSHAVRERTDHRRGRHRRKHAQARAADDTPVRRRPARHARRRRSHRRLVWHHRRSGHLSGRRLVHRHRLAGVRHLPSQRDRRPGPCRRRPAFPRGRQRLRDRADSAHFHLRAGSGVSACACTAGGCSRKLSRRTPSP